MPFLPESTHMRLVNRFRSTVESELKKYWVAVAPTRKVAVEHGLALEAQLQAVFDVLLSRPHRLGPMPTEKTRDDIVARLRRNVVQGQPVEISLVYATGKNHQAIAYNRADWAEFFALSHLVAWHNKVQKIYAPGLRIQLYLDDVTGSQLNRHNRLTYMQSISSLIDAMNYSPLFSKPALLSSLSWKLRLGMHPWAAMRVRRWDRQPENSQTLEKMDQVVGRQLMLKSGLASPQQMKKIQEISFRRRVAFEALHLAGVTNSDKRLIAIYQDGDLFSIQKQLALRLTALELGQITPPWQGEGALLENEDGQWEPIVLTAQRRQRTKSILLTGLKVLDLEGFDVITVAKPVAFSTSTMSASQQTARAKEAALSHQ